jgi:hypothetical protein
MRKRNARRVLAGTRPGNFSFGHDVLRGGSRGTLIPRHAPRVNGLARYRLDGAGVRHARR